MRNVSMLSALALVLVLATACEESGAGGREVTITQTEEGCLPVSIPVAPGEKLQFVVTNESGHDVYELEGIEGTKLEEFVVPSGKTRKAGYTVPSDGSGMYKLKCYVPTGNSTIIELIAAGSEPRAETTPEEAPGGDDAATGVADDTVNVGLIEYSVTPDKAEVKAGAIRFVAKNTSPTQMHELAVLKKLDDGTVTNEGEVEDIPAGASGEVILELGPGAYELACLIVPGEAGSTVDHYEEGMHVDFTVAE